MNVIIIGAGRVGTVIGYLLHNNGFNIIGVSNKHINSARRAVELIGAGKPFTRHELQRNIKNADLIIITTPDDVIKNVVSFLDCCNLKSPVYIMHMSGLHPARILNKDKTEERNVFSLHPLQSISNFDEGLKLLPAAIFSLEGDNKGLELGGIIANKLNLHYHIINSENKSLYHAAAVIASNYLVTLINSSYNILKEAGIEDEKIKKGILNLVSGTLSNLNNTEPKNALTGPIARNDINTVKEHRKKLKKLASNELKLYDILGEYTVKMTGENREQLLELLKSDKS